MSHSAQATSAEVETPRRLYVYNSGFLTKPRIKRILGLSGWTVKIGRPSDTDWVGVWGDAPSAQRGLSVAEGTSRPVLRVEDAFLRSLHPGRVGNEPPLGLLLDQTGLHFDASRPSDLETLLLEHGLDDTALLNEARDLMGRLQRLKLSKYSAYDPDCALPDPGYVLVIDQAEGDASVTASVPGSDTARARFAEMLYYAQVEHPAARILITSHPETRAGKRGGHYSDDQATGRVSFVEGNPAPVDLLNGAIAVYTVSSQMGFEAILAGHKPRVFGTPFYAGWGLSQDEHDLYRRQRQLTRAQLFAAAMMIFPKWYDPYSDTLCDLRRVLDSLEAMQRAWLDDHLGWYGKNIKLWKRPHMQAMFGQHVPMRFGSGTAHAPMRTMTWGASTQKDVWCVEDGFLRSNGLGANLVPPLSLALDDLGIYYDPSQSSRLEKLISASPTLTEVDLQRARRLMDALISKGVTKYAARNKDAELPETGGRPVILVPGQVENDASILLGSREVVTNEDLLKRVRGANAEAFIVFKPHPDVLAGLRPGKVRNALAWADLIVEDVAVSTWLAKTDAVWTMTSLTGFEALIRGVRVTTLGIPFYAGWGLTTDLCPMPDRRNRVVTLEGLVHAALIGYPRYFDPVTGLPCPVEVAVDRLTQRADFHPKPLKILSKAQGLMASYAWLWRR